jgi:hypothetical protein
MVRATTAEVINGKTVTHTHTHPERERERERDTQVIESTNWNGANWESWLLLSMEKTEAPPQEIADECAFLFNPPFGRE